MWRKLQSRGLAVLACAVTLAAAAENGTNTTLTSEAHAESLWWTQPYEVYHLEEVTIVVLVAITLMIDAVQHKLAKLTRSRKFWSDEFEEEELSEVDHSSREPMPYLLWSRGTAEFTVLGIIACIVWVCNRSGVFSWIDRMLKDVNDIALPFDAEGYHLNVESVHMHLFVTFALYYSTISCSIFVAGHWMRSWAASNAVHAYQRQIRAFRAGKDCCETFVETDWTPEYVNLRQTFVASTARWRTATDRVDGKLQVVRERYLGVETDSISDFFTTRFPFTPYVVENYRDMLESMVEIQLSSLACLAVVEGVQAIVHRFQIDFDFGYIWMAFFFLVLAAMYWYTWSFHCKLKRGQYLKEDLKSAGMVKLSSVPGRICMLIQICFLLFCFELTRPSAHSYAWILDQVRSIVHSVACILLIPVGGLLLGHLLAQLAVVLSCSPERPVNEARIRLIWERHQLAKLIGQSWPLKGAATNGHEVAMNGLEGGRRRSL